MENDATLSVRVELIRDPPDRTIVGVNRALWDALGRQRGRRFAPPGGKLGPRVLVVLGLDALRGASPAQQSDGPAPAVSRGLTLRRKNVARALVPRQAWGTVSPCGTDSDGEVAPNSAASIGHVVSYAVLRDVPGEAATLWVSQEWLEDNKIPVSLLFPDYNERLRNGELPVGTCTVSTCGFVELSEVILECDGGDDHSGEPASTEGTIGGEVSPNWTPYGVASHQNSRALIQALKSNLLPILRQKSDVVMQLPIPDSAADGLSPKLMDIRVHVLMCGPTVQGVVGDRTVVVVVKSPREPAVSDHGESGRKSDKVVLSVDAVAPDSTNGTERSDAAPINGLKLKSDDLLSPDDDWESASVDSSDSTAWLDTLVPEFGQGTGEREVQVDGLSLPVPLSQATEALAGLPHESMLRTKSFLAVPLAAPFPSAGLHPPVQPGDDTGNIVLVDWKQMASARWGNVVSGDWVLLRSLPAEGEDDTPDDGRMARIFGIEVDAAVGAFWKRQLAATPNLPGACCWMSPLLHYNLRSGAAGLGNYEIKISILPSPYNRQPPHEAADVVLTRIASPSLNKRDVLDAALDGLKAWFEAGARVVSAGDFLPIVVDLEDARVKAKVVEPTAKVVSLANARNDSDAAATKDIVYFKVVSIKPPAVRAPQYGRSFIVNPLKSTMTESGVEFARYPPGIRDYLHGAARSQPKRASDEPLAADPSRFVTSLISTTLLPSAPGLNLSLTLLLHGPKGGGKRHLIKQCCAATRVNYLEINCYDIAGDSEAKTETNLRDEWKLWEDACPVVVVMRNLEALSKMDKGEEVAGKQPHLATVLQDLFKRLPNIQLEHNLCPLICVGTTSDPEKLPQAVRGCFRHELRIDAPDEDQRRGILQGLTERMPLAPDVRIENLALQTAALSARDLRDMVGRAALESLKRASLQLAKPGEEASESDTAALEHDILAAGVCLTAKDFEMALEKSRKEHADSIGAPKIPTVTWDDVGGLASVKSQIMDTIQLPLEHPELFAGGMKKRSGILLYGPPGTGKTLLAKAVATEFTLNFLSVKGPELLNMYIGESEANVRKVFQRARDARPCVIFFDELDSVAPKRGDKGDSGGVMDRIVSQLLAELDGMSSAGGSGKGDVFVIGATNRPDLLDSALLRPGRFDKLLYLGVSDDHDSQLKIIEALTRKFRLHPDLDLRKVAEKCPFNYTGADFYALCSDAMLKAMVRKIAEVDEKIEAMNKAGPREGAPYPITPSYYLEHMAAPSDYLVEVQEVDFDAAQRELVPSVPMAELERYLRIRQRFETATAKKEEKGVEEVADVE
ncbi:P-loop containing nucleoside triphosphate hydrolase protein [Hyaloraphidium curvatum]|nr:P-loop containing nucleoside triphosphate hydrolase protein [Hyaloraphidium curvatum]